MSESDSPLSAFVDYVTLTYHEARNVRHLIRAGHIALGTYQTLTNLPTNREDAWGALQDTRSAAKKASSANAVEAIFQRTFGPGLEDLVLLFDNPNWRHSARGGNRWAYITRALIDLRDAIDSDNVANASELLATLPYMRHNTGVVMSKLRDLDRCP
jgi:hypothetical protein